MAINDPLIRQLYGNLVLNAWQQCFLSDGFINVHRAQYLQGHNRFRLRGMNGQLFLIF